MSKYLGNKMGRASRRPGPCELAASLLALPASPGVNMITLWAIVPPLFAVLTRGTLGTSYAMDIHLVTDVGSSKEPSDVLSFEFVVSIWHPSIFHESLFS